MAARGSVGTFQTSDGYGKMAFTTSGKGSDLTLQRGQTIYALNSNVGLTTSNIFSTISNVHSAIPAISSGGNIYLGAVGFPPSGQNSNVFAPSVAINVWKNNDEKEFYRGVKNSNDPTAASIDGDTIFSYASETKSVSALMYARLKSLGIVGNIKRVDEIYPQMRNINFVESYLSTTYANAITDYSLGSNTQTVYKLATDVYGCQFPGVQNVTSPQTYVTPNYFAGPNSGLMFSNNYIHMYDFDATLAKYNRDLNVATINPTGKYTVTQAGKQIFNYDFTSNVTDGSGGGIFGSIAAVSTNCGFLPVIQAFEQNSRGVVPGNIIAYKMKQSVVGGTITGVSGFASGYGLNIGGSLAITNDPRYSNSYTATFGASNLFTPVYTTQYLANVGTSSIFVNGTTISKTEFGGLLDPINTVHPLSIPTGVTYNQAYTDNPYNAFLFAAAGITVGPIASTSSNVFYSPLSSNIYINVSTSNRPLYMDDIFSESVGFVGGFEQWLFGNGTYGAIWGGGNRQYDSPIGYNSVVDALKPLGLNVIAELARSSVCLAANTNPLNHCTDMFSNVSNVTSNTSVLPVPWFANQSANTLVTNFFNSFSGKTYVQLLPHGVQNYNSSGHFGTACITELYNRYYGTSNTYAEILRKELLDPVGSNMGYGTEAGALSKFSSTWLVDPSTYIYYIPSDHPNSPFVGLNASNVSSFSGRLIAANEALSGSQRYYPGTAGLCGTVKDLSKVFRIVARKGLDENGRTLISQAALGDIVTPRVSLVEYIGTQKYCATFLTLTAGPGYGLFSMGGALLGPGYSSATSSDPALQQANTPMGRLIRDAFGAASVWYAPTFNSVSRTWGWGGATGIFASASLDEQAVVVVSCQDSQSEFGNMIISAVLGNLGEDVAHPKSNTYVYSSSGVAVPLIPEIGGGQK